MKPNPTQTLVAFCLLFAAFSLLPSGAFAQTVEAASPLEGQWVLENAAAFKITGSDTLAIDVNTVKNNSSIVLYDTLTFKGNRLSLPFRNTYVQGKYSWTDKAIKIPFMSAPLLLDYVIKDEKVCFTQQISVGCEGCTYFIQTIYKKVSHENNK